MSAAGERRLVERRAARGSNPAESAALLAELLASVEHGENLVHALVYNQFATEAGARRFLAELEAGE